MIEGKWPIADQAARIARNRAFVDEVNARTVCAHCGAQPIEWHNPDHVRQGKQHRRIARLAGKTYSIAAIGWPSRWFYSTSRAPKNEEATDPVPRVPAAGITVETRTVQAMLRAPAEQHANG
jgi:hypothetical protein